MILKKFVAIISLFIVFSITFFTPFLCFAIVWHNWGNNQVCESKEIKYPSSLREVQDLIKLAGKEQEKIRFIGSSHSWSDLVCTPGYLVNTDKLNKIIEINKEARTVKVEGGIKIKDLIKILADNDLALSNQGFIAEQSIAGAISTATHGSSFYTGCLSDFIVELEIVDGLGNFHKISKDTNPGWLPILRVSLGALGCIYSVTIQCEDLFVLTHHRCVTGWDEAVKDYENNYRENDFYMFMGHPELDLVLHFFWNKSKQPIDSVLLYDLKDTFLNNNFISRMVIRSANFMPSLTSRLFAWWLHFIEKAPHNQHSHISLSPLKCPVSVKYYIEEELGVPVENFTEAIGKFRALCTDFRQKGNVGVGLITCRFLPAAYDSYLSPAYGRDTAFITVNFINYFSNYEEFFKQFEQILAPFKPRPHWGKFHYLDQQKVFDAYGDNVTKFNNLRKQLDPHSLFSNGFIDRCFGGSSPI